MEKSEWEKLKERAQQLRRGIHFKNGAPKKGIQEMNLTELLEAQKRYLEWLPRAEKANHPRLEIKKYIYQSYLLPRIEELKKIKKQDDKMIKQADEIFSKPVVSNADTP